jgi:hypothetical protein
MKPLNLDNKPCSPISSNCVIWQGPDIPCIKLCTGDTVSDVVNKLATELCAIMDQLNITNYDLSCFDLAACPPQTFQQLIQFLIDQICLAQGITTTDGKVSGCPDCLVSVAPCFQIGNQTTMQLVDYVQMIAERVCSIIDQITVINNQIQNLEIRVEILENTPPPVFTLPSIATNCFAAIIGSASATIDVVLNALINDPTIGYCQLIGATGDPVDILAAVATQCIDSTDPSLSNPGETMGSAYGPYTGFGTWNNTPITAADAINNLWIALCDIYNYLVAGGDLAVLDTTTVNLTYTGGVLQADVQDTGWKDLLGFGYMAGNANRPQCRRIGNEVHFRGYLTVPMGNAGEGAAGTVNAAPLPDSYVPLTYGKTFNTVDSGSAVDSCKLTTHNGANWTGATAALALTFNRGNSVIPSGILSPGQSFDGSYTHGTRQIIFRTVSVTDGEPSPTYKDAALHSIVGCTLRSTGELVMSTVLTEESYKTSTSGFEYSAIGRNLISNIISGENVPTYTPTAPSQYNAAASGAYSNSNLTGLSYFWAFDQNAGKAEELGGFQMRLDGLRAFIDPCDPTITTPTPCI